jgi:hypothetical protein
VHFDKININKETFRQFASTSLMRFVVGMALGLAAIHYYYAGPIDPGKIALGSETAEARETWQGQPITGTRVRAIRSIVDGLSTALAARPRPDRPIVVWLGNSQLHAINQFKPGDHLAPYWLVERADCHDCFLPLGISLPNANMQEQYVLELDITRRIPVKMVIVELCYDNLREDGLRDEFELMMDGGLRADLRQSGVGRNMLAAWDARTKVDPDAEDVSGLQGFLQRPLEKFLVRGLAQVFPLWAARPSLRGQFLDDLYWTRNWLLGITPSTVRKPIQPRYERNMRALETMLADLSRKHITVIGYIAPIRHDLPIPYEIASYEAWKAEVAALGANYGMTLLNLEGLVPNDQWGTYHKNDVDFMHFQGPGHILVADALRPTVMRLLAGNE